MLINFIWLAMFDMNKESKRRIEYLEKEREKLWARIVEIEQKVDTKPSDYEKEAIQASKKAAEYRNKTEKRLNEANDLYANLEALKGEVLKESQAITAANKEIKTLLEDSTSSSRDISDKGALLTDKCNRLDEIFDQYPNLKTDINELSDQMASIEDSSNKANLTYKGILTKKTQIDSLHGEILGYEDEDEDGEPIQIAGLKDQLEKAYDKLQEDSVVLEIKVKEIATESNAKVDAFIEENKKDIKKVADNSNAEYEAINAKISSLLPDAMTAGLSSAFIAKKGEEEELYKEHKKKFSRGIQTLAWVSLLPIAISVYSLASGVELSIVIQRAPNIILAFLPLYIPLVWTTISANKKVNLSKRLIEEYSHKQVLSMTIEGLSNQIEEIDDDEVAGELRTRLLSNFLQVTSENPGKLISNYQKSDNPMLNLLDRDKKKDREKDIVETVKDKAQDMVEEAVEDIGNKAVEKITNP